MTTEEAKKRLRYVINSVYDCEISPEQLNGDMRSYLLHLAIQFIPDISQEDMMRYRKMMENNKFIDYDI